ncbi:MAG TPA: DegV family protein, partial [Gammaproteobacteria bacterium]|nr:DegV family protein [Gammaproteobacteria bacterium]
IDVDGRIFSDHHDDTEIRRFLDEKVGARSHSAGTEPYSPDQIQSLFLDRLVTDYDCVFCLTITATRSPIHANATSASFGILNSYRPLRNAAGLKGPFRLSVIDTQTLFAGSGVVVVEGVRLADSEQTPAQIRERLEHVAHNTYAYMLPRDLYYLRARAKKKGDRSVGLASVALGSALDIKPLLRGWRGDTGPVARIRGFEPAAESLFNHVADRVRQGLLVPAVCLSYGGNLEEMRALPGYSTLSDTCADCGVQMLESLMSITGMVNVGEGAITVGFACNEYQASF